MKQRKGISTFSARITATISVALVLLLLGIVAAIGIAARSVTTSIKENMGFDVVMAEEAPESSVNRLKKMWNSSPYVSSYTYYSPDDAMRQWQHDTGENLMELLGVNPFSPEFEVKVKAQYASVDSIDRITASLRDLDGVAEVNVHAEMVESVNNNLHTIMLILVVAAGALTLISFVLINNTVRLTVYSKRFLIHTMRLVGATHGFIRRPFIIGNAIQGIAAALVAHGHARRTAVLCAFGRRSRRECDRLGRHGMGIRRHAHSRRSDMHACCIHRHQPVSAAELRRNVQINTEKTLK